MPEINENQQAYELAEARRNRPPENQAETNDADSPGVSSSGNSGKVVSSQWMIMFTATGIFWLIALATSFLIPVIATAVINYLVVFSLWLWAKSKGLKPPTFATAAKGAAGAALKAAGPEGQAAAGVVSVADQAPGSDILYIALGGISPIFYLTALWYNNR